MWLSIIATTCWKDCYTCVQNMSQVLYHLKQKSLCWRLNIILRTYQVHVLMKRSTDSIWHLYQHLTLQPKGYLPRTYSSYTKHSYKYTSLIHHFFLMCIYRSTTVLCYLWRHTRCTTYLITLFNKSSSVSWPF